MTPVGHALTGLSLAAVSMPPGLGVRRKVATVGVFLFVSGLPDLPLPFWGHAQYHISHSIFLNMALIGLLWVLFSRWSGIARQAGGPTLMLGVSAAWMIHMLLDTLYNHGQGIAIFWPISQAKLALPLPWFEALDGRRTLTPETARILAIEAAFYGPLLGLCVLGRKFLAQVRRSTPDRSLHFK